MTTKLTTKTRIEASCQLPLLFVHLFRLTTMIHSDLQSTRSEEDLNDLAVVVVVETFEVTMMASCKLQP